MKSSGSLNYESKMGLRTSKVYEAMLLNFQIGKVTKIKENSLKSILSRQWTLELNFLVGKIIKNREKVSNQFYKKLKIY